MAHGVAGVRGGKCQLCAPKKKPRWARGFVSNCLGGGGNQALPSALAMCLRRSMTRLE